MPVHKLRRLSMPLAQEDFDSITRHIKENLPKWLAEQNFVQPPYAYELMEIRVRIIRTGFH
ncbi:MAG: hypothetical protein U5L00_06075 [Desulfovermiculus sp.]|nr:hypothetical protein [Desulfovermiculus sp.]